MTQNINWKDIGIRAIVIFFVSLMAFSVFNLIIEPTITDKPELEILVIEPKLVDGGEVVSFDIIIENIGEKTAADLICGAMENNYSRYTIIETPSFVRKGETTHLMFNMSAPDEDFKSTWNIKLDFLYKSNQVQYYKRIDIIYEYVVESNQYHKISP